jgi:two-component system sensor histidine kinase TctE
MKKRPFTLRHLLLQWLTVPLAILWTISTTIDYNVALNAANRAYDQSLFNKLLALVKQVDVETGQLQVQLPQEALDILNASDQDHVYYQVRDLQGKLIFGYVDLPIVPSNTTPTYYDETYRGENIRIVSLRAKIDKNHDALIEVARTTFKRQESITEMLLSMVIPQILLVLIAMLSVWYAIGRGLTPLLQIRNEIMQRSLSDLSPIPQTNVPVEIQPLIQGFNELIARLGNLLAAQHRFIADAAHQLRTPLAGLKAQTELALRLEHPDDIHHSLEQIHKATKQANRLAQQLLALARAEPEAQQHDLMAALDLVVLAKKITADWIANALNKNIDLGFEGPETPCLIHANAMLLGELLNNLIDNALRYTPANGIVTVRITQQGDHATIEVEDDGPGIPLAAREQVFDRFYRVLGSNQEGCGLGLSIVREIAHRHHTEVQLLSGENERGTRMRITFQLTTPPINPVTLGSGEYHVEISP